MISLDEPSDSIDDPFPVRVFDNVLDPDFYACLLATLPADGMVPIGAAGNKVTFNNRDALFLAWLERNPDWHEFYFGLLYDFSSMCGNLLGTRPGSAFRFEFSRLPANDGGVWPHTDTQRKIATAVLFMEPDWRSEWGGAFEVLRHRTAPDADFTGLKPGWGEVETVLEVPLVPRRMLFMRRTNNSLHGVRPLRSPRPRRSVTINLLEFAA